MAMATAGMPEREAIMNRAIADVTLYLFALENRLLQILAESYLVAAIGFLVIALGCIAGLCLSKSERQRQSRRAAVRTPVQRPAVLARVLRRPAALSRSGKGNSYSSTPAI